MSYGQAEKPCDDFIHWFGNGTLCGRCAWQRKDHSEATYPVIEQIVFALTFDNEVIGYKKWSEENANWMYSETYNRHSVWKFEPPESAYSKIELVHIYPKTPSLFV